MLRSLRAAIAVVAMVGVLAVLVPNAAGQSEIDRARAEVAEATAELELLLDRLEATQRAGNELTAQFWLIESEVVVLGEQVEATTLELAALAEVRQAAEAEVREFAVQSYVARGEVAPWADANSVCLLYTSPSPRDATLSRMPSSA